MPRAPICSTMLVCHGGIKQQVFVVQAATFSSIVGGRSINDDKKPIQKTFPSHSVQRMERDGKVLEEG